MVDRLLPVGAERVSPPCIRNLLGRHGSKERRHVARVDKALKLSRMHPRTVDGEIDAARGTTWAGPVCLSPDEFVYVYQLIENYILHPTIIGKAAEISSFTVLARLLAFRGALRLDRRDHRRANRRGTAASASYDQRPDGPSGPLRWRSR